MSFLQLFAFLGPKVIVALLCGGIVGLERELKHKAAGIKTNMLICVGSALYSAMSVLISTAFADSGYYGDPARIAAQIVSGIGFLGGGAIIQARGTIVGLTTAASIWVVAAIGICVGLGFPSLGLATSIIVVSVLVGITSFENRILRREHTFSCDLHVEDPEGRFRDNLYGLMALIGLQLEDFEVVAQGHIMHYHLKYRGNHENHKRLILELWKTPGVREVKQR